MAAFGQPFDPTASMDSSRFSDFANGSTRRVVSTWQYASRQPSWVARAALVTFMLVIAVPVLLFLTFAIVIAAGLFFVLAGVNLLLSKVRGILPRSDGRENVVVRRRQ